MRSLPNLHTNQSMPQIPQSQRQENQLMGSVIVQNWETAKNIPEDIGELIHFPVLIDRKKYRYKDIDTEEDQLILPEDRKLKFSKLAIKNKGQKKAKIKKLYH